MFSAGDSAAVPDLTQPGRITPPTAQHAIRQGKALARNVAASLGYGRKKYYKHKNMGLVVDLGPRYAVANPNGRVSYPWCLPEAEFARGPLLHAALSSLAARGVKTAWAAYRSDWNVALDFLSEAAVGDYVERRLRATGHAAALAHVLHANTGGNALFLVTMVDDLIARGHVREADGRFELAIPVEQIASTGSNVERVPR